MNDKIILILLLMYSIFSDNSLIISEYVLVSFYYVLLNGTILVLFPVEEVIKYF